MKTKFSILTVTAICFKNAIRPIQQLSKHEFVINTKFLECDHCTVPGQTLGDGKRQGGLACCSPRRYKESDTTGRLNNNNPCSQKTHARVLRGEAPLFLQLILKWFTGGIYGCIYLSKKINNFSLVKAIVFHYSCMNVRVES